MPLVPKFKISQDDEFVYIRINVPYVKVSEAEMIAEGRDFSFYCKPYLLKLTFPHPFDGSDEERCRAVYDLSMDNGVITGHLPKLVKGQVFEDLDLITTLLQKRIVKDHVPGLNIPHIEVLQSVDDVTGESDTSAADITSTTSSDGIINISKPRYGFNQGYMNVLAVLAEESILEMQGNPDIISVASRRSMQHITENELFSPERYLGDLFQGEHDVMYQEIMRYDPFWNIAWENRKAEAGHESMLFDEIERDTMLSLPHKEYIIISGSYDEKSVLMCMIDILYAYCYDHRFNMGESTSESSESITRLSSVLSWLRIYNPATDTIMTVIQSICRRSMIYPYFRLWKVTRKVLADVAKILYMGKRCILRCFLRLHRLLEHTDQHYILNKLFITDYCVWLQTVSDESLASLAKDFNEAKRVLEGSEGSGKAMIRFNLVELEAWAKELMTKQRAEEEDSDDEVGLESLPDIPAHLTTYPPEEVL